MTREIRITAIAACVCILGLIAPQTSRAMQTDWNPCNGGDGIICLSYYYTCDLSEPQEACANVLQAFGCPGFVGQAYCTSAPACNPYDAVYCNFGSED